MPIPYRRFFQEIRRRLRDALPMIIFYIAQFVLVCLLFGRQYVMIVSSATTLFQIRRNQRNDLGTCLRLFLVPLLLCPLAFAAIRSLTLCIVLNFVVMFFLVIWKSSQFEPKGYLGFAMTFIFLELCPTTASGHFWQQTAVVAFCHGLLLAALGLYGLLRRPEDPAVQVRRNLLRMAELLNQLAEGQGDEEAEKEFYEMAQQFHRMGYARRHLFPLPDRRREIYHLLALLFQRASYLIEDDSWQESRNLPAFPLAMQTLAELVRDYTDHDAPRERDMLRRRIRTLLNIAGLPEGRLEIFYQSVLQLLLLLCRDSDFKPVTSLWKVNAWRDAWEEVRRRCAPDRVEFRFAMQLAVVMTISCTVSYLWEFERTYWFPLQAFFLLQPSYEDSAHRLFTRPVGTAIGCVVVQLVYPYLPGVPGVFAFSLVMISIMYCCTPGTWVHPIFSTSYALAMTSLSVAASQAVWLRLLYLGLAVALVLAVNCLLFPNRREQQFRSNLRELLRLQAVYWRAIRRSLRDPVWTPQFSTLLAQFHMVYRETAQYLRSLPKEEACPYRSRLVRVWAMFSELEQVEGLVQARAIRPAEYDPLDQAAETLSRWIYPLHRDVGDLPLDGIQQEDLRRILRAYLCNAGQLSRCVSRES